MVGFFLDGIFAPSKSSNLTVMCETVPDVCLYGNLICGVYCEHTWRVQQAFYQYVASEGGKGGWDGLGMSSMGECLLLLCLVANG